MKMMTSPLFSQDIYIRIVRTRWKYGHWKEVVSLRHRWIYFLFLIVHIPNSVSTKIISENKNTQTISISVY